MDEIIYSSASEMARAIRGGEVSSAEVVEAHLKRIGEANPKLNAVVHLTADAARARAREADEARARGEEWGPLHGVPVTVKDAFETEGVVSAGGTSGRAAYVPERDAAGVAAQAERRHPRGDGRALAAAAAARRARPVVGVVRAAVDEVVALEGERDFGDVGLAEDDRARGFKTRDAGRVPLGNVRGAPRRGRRCLRLRRRGSQI